MKRAFTLLELLVVISIISILLSLTLPAVSRARNKIYSSLCTSNLKNIGRGANVYTMDYDGFSMPASFGNTSDGGLNHFINYLHTVDGYPEKIFKCPLMDEEDMFDPAGHNPEVGNVLTKASYIMNIIKPGSWSGSGLGSTNNIHGWGLDSVTPIRVGMVTNPSAKLHIMDVMEGISNSHSGVNKFQRSDHGIISDPPTGLKRWVGVLHDGSYNSVFGDGHVARVGLSQAVDWAVNR